jgi:hypothetical protein
MGKIEIDLTLQFTMPENGLTVNSLLYGVRKNMPKVFFAISKALFAAIEERTIENLQSSAPGRFVRNGHQHNLRQFHTSFGVFKYRLAQLHDKTRGKVYPPLIEKLSVPAYHRCMEEACESGIGLVVHMSYRNSAKEAERITGNAIGKSALHRALQKFAETQCDRENLKKIPYRFLMVDGTKVILQEGKNRTSRKVEMRWALASIAENQRFDLVGFWIDKSWAYIHQDLNKILDYSKLEVLLSDGGPGIEKSLLEEGMGHQRCLWHGKRDFPFILYLDGFKKKEQEPLKEKLNSIPAFNLRKADLETIRDDDLPKVKKLAERTNQGFQDLINTLDPNKYPKARVYIENLSQRVTTFFEWWLENRKWIPLNTNAIESAFSRVKNRVRFIGKRWSEHGLINWLKVCISKVFFPSRWQKLWDQYLEVNPAMKMELVRVKYRWV